MRTLQSNIGVMPSACLSALLMLAASGSMAAEPTQMAGCLSPFGVLTKLALGDQPARACWPKEQEVRLQLGPVSESAAKRVFVTSHKFTGNLGGVSGADAKCQAAADTANLGGTWHSWISDSSASPATTFVRSAAPYIRLDGTIIAMNWDDLVNGSILAPIEVDENGAYVPASAVMTNTLPEGTAYNRSCSDWTSQVEVDQDAGYSASADYGWSFRGGFYFKCAELNRLYCFEQ